MSIIGDCPQFLARDRIRFVQRVSLTRYGKRADNPPRRTKWHRDQHPKPAFSRIAPCHEPTRRMVTSQCRSRNVNVTHATDQSPRSPSAVMVLRIRRIAYPRHTKRIIPNSIPDPVYPLAKAAATSIIAERNEKKRKDHVAQPPSAGEPPQENPLTPMRCCVRGRLDEK